MKRYLILLFQIRKSSNDGMWGVANGGCNKCGLKGCLASLSGNRPFPATFFSGLFRACSAFSPFPEPPAKGARGESRKRSLFASSVLGFLYTPIS